MVVCVRRRKIVFFSCFKMGLVDRGFENLRKNHKSKNHKRVLVDCIKTSDRYNDVSISLSLEPDYVQGEV